MTKTLFLLTWILAVAPSGAVARTSDDEMVRWFQSTEQALMDSIARGDKSVWDRVMDPTCVVTSEEGQTIGKRQFLEELRPLPPGLTGAITVRELTVDEYPGFAVVRFLAEESLAIFAQRLETRYRVTNTYRRDGSSWKMVSSHLAVVTQDPPPQEVSRSQWPAFVGTYRLLPDGWTFTVALHDGEPYGGRDPAALKKLIPLSSSAFVLSGSLGEWIFDSEPEGGAIRLLNFRKFAPLIWTRIEGQP